MLNDSNYTFPYHLVLAEAMIFPLTFKLVRTYFRGFLKTMFLMISHLSYRSIFFFKTLK